MLEISKQPEAHRQPARTAGRQDAAAVGDPREKLRERHRQTHRDRGEDLRRGTDRGSATRLPAVRLHRQAPLHAQALRLSCCEKSNARVLGLPRQTVAGPQAADKNLEAVRIGPERRWVLCQLVRTQRRRVAAFAARGSGVSRGRWSVDQLAGPVATTAARPHDCCCQPGGGHSRPPTLLVLC